MTTTDLAPVRDRSAWTAADVETAQAAFLHDWPEYAATRHLDEARAADYARLDAGGDVGRAANHACLTEHSRDLLCAVDAVLHRYDAGVRPNERAGLLAG